MSKPFRVYKKKIIDMLTTIPPTLVAINFRYDSDQKTLLYDEIPIITILSISTGDGDYEYEIINDIKQNYHHINICLIIIDPNKNVNDYNRFQTITRLLYVNPYLEGFSILFFESMGFPKKTFKSFYNLIWQNLTHPDFVFGTNLQWGTIKKVYSTNLGQQTIDLNYRSPECQDLLSGFRPTPSYDQYGYTIWQKKKKHKRNFYDDSIYRISQFFLIHVLKNRKIWRYYETIQNPFFIPTVILSNVGRNQQNEILFIEGIPKKGKNVEIHNFKDLLDFFINYQT